MISQATFRSLPELLIFVYLGVLAASLSAHAQTVNGQVSGDSNSQSVRQGGLFSTQTDSVDPSQTESLKRQAKEKEDAQRLALLQQIQLAFKLGNYEKTRQLAEAYLQKDSKNVTAHYYLANAYGRLARPKDAIAHYVFCTQYGKGTQAAVYSAQAIQQLEKLLNGPGSSNLYGATASGSGAGTPGIKTGSAAGATKSPSNISTKPYQPRSANELKAFLLQEGSDKVDAIRAKSKETIAGWQKVHDAEVKDWDYHRKGYDPYGDGSDPDYERYMKKNEELRQRIFALNKETSKATLAVETEYRLKVQSIDDQKDQIDLLLKQPTDVKALVRSLGLASSPIGVGRNVKSYVNYGMDDEVDSIPDEPALSAKAGQVKNKASSSKSPDKTNGNNKNKGKVQ